jgi:endonuclease/exonuclease/phosphatase family metal-dependent hydrolase
VLILSWGQVCASQALKEFTVGTYNLENYLEAPAGNRPVKSAAARAKIRENIRAIKADVLGLQEVGGSNALQGLRLALKSEGLDYPYWELVSGADTNIQVGVLSRFPITARRPHTNESFLLYGRRFRLTRGIAEVDIQVTTHYAFTFLVAHLKSRRPVAEADEAEVREQEGIILREKIEARLQREAPARLVLVGDMNDAKDAKSMRAILGKGRTALVDTRPAERNGDPSPTGRAGAGYRNITWTHFYAKEDAYSRFDYILLSPGMAHDWDAGRTYVLSPPNWGLASDHRPLVAAFVIREGE